MVSKGVTINKRNYKHFSLARFHNDLRHQSILNEAWTKWKEMFLYISDIHVPRKNVKVKSSGAPWITRELCQLMRQRDQVHKAASCTPNLGQMFDDHIPPWLQNESLFKFTFNPVSEEFVVKELKKLPNKHKLDVLGFDSYLLRNCAIQIAPVITYFINLSLMSGTVPPELKMAQVSPIFKNKGSADLPENYRPISVVSHLAKILEKAVCHQLWSILLIIILLHLINQHS